MVAVVGLIVLGPDKLPHYAREAGKMLRQLRTMANNATAEIKAELGPELADLDVRDLHPKAMLRKYMDAEDEQPSVATGQLPAVASASESTGEEPEQKQYDDVT